MKKKVKARIENNKFDHNLTTIRTVDCETIITNNKIWCQACKEHRKILNIQD